MSKLLTAIDETELFIDKQMSELDEGQQETFIEEIAAFLAARALED
jgi:hypothetical protein